MELFGFCGLTSPPSPSTGYPISQQRAPTVWFQEVGDGEIVHLAPSGIAFSPLNERQERTLEGRADSRRPLLRLSQFASHVITGEELMELSTVAESR